MDELDYVMGHLGPKIKEMNNACLKPTPWSCIATHNHVFVGQTSIRVPEHLYSSPLHLEKQPEEADNTVNPAYFRQ